MESYVSHWKSSSATKPRSYLCPFCPTLPRKTLGAFIHHGQTHHKSLSLPRCPYSDCYDEFSTKEEMSNVMLHLYKHAHIHAKVQRVCIEAIPMEHGFYCFPCCASFASSIIFEIHQKQIHSDQWEPPLTAQQWLDQVLPNHRLILANISSKMELELCKGQEEDSSSATTSSCMDDESTSCSSHYYEKKKPFRPLVHSIV